MPYAMVMRSLKVVFVVVNRILPPLPTRMEFPRFAGLAGLIVATSNTGFASAAIGFGGGGGSGMAHAVCGVARLKVSGKGPPWVKVPEIELPSPLIFPS